VELEAMKWLELLKVAIALRLTLEGQVTPEVASS
jgi:hypothetical protein